MTREQIRDYLEFYRDLGFESIYTRPAFGTAAAVAEDRTSIFAM